MTDKQSNTAKFAKRVSANERNDKKLSREKAIKVNSSKGNKQGSKKSNLHKEEETPAVVIDRDNDDNEVVDIPADLADMNRSNLEKKGRDKSRLIDFVVHENGLGSQLTEEQRGLLEEAYKLVSKVTLTDNELAAPFKPGIDQKKLCISMSENGYLEEYLSYFPKTDWFKKRLSGLYDVLADSLITNKNPRVIFNLVNGHILLVNGMPFSIYVPRYRADFLREVMNELGLGDVKKLSNKQIKRITYHAHFKRKGKIFGAQACGYKEQPKLDLIQRFPNATTEGKNVLEHGYGVGAVTKRDLTKGSRYKESLVTPLPEHIETPQAVPAVKVKVSKAAKLVMAISGPLTKEQKAERKRLAKEKSAKQMEDSCAAAEKLQRKLDKEWERKKAEREYNLKNPPAKLVEVRLAREEAQAQRLADIIVKATTTVEVDKTLNEAVHGKGKATKTDKGGDGPRNVRLLYEQMPVNHKSHEHQYCEYISDKLFMRTGFWDDNFFTGAGQYNTYRSIRLDMRVNGITSLDQFGSASYEQVYNAFDEMDVEGMDLALSAYKLFTVFLAQFPANITLVVNITRHPIADKMTISITMTTYSNEHRRLWVKYLQRTLKKDNVIVITSHSIVPILPEITDEGCVACTTLNGNNGEDTNGDDLMRNGYSDSKFKSSKSLDHRGNRRTPGLYDGLSQNITANYEKYIDREDGITSTDPIARAKRISKENSDYSNGVMGLCEHLYYPKEYNGRCECHECSVPQNSMASFARIPAKSLIEKNSAFHTENTLKLGVKAGHDLRKAIDKMKQKGHKKKPSRFVKCACTSDCKHLRYKRVWEQRVDDTIVLYECKCQDAHICSTSNYFIKADKEVVRPCYADLIPQESTVENKVRFRDSKNIYTALDDITDQYEHIEITERDAFGKAKPDITVDQEYQSFCNKRSLMMNVNPTIPEQDLTALAELEVDEEEHRKKHHLTVSYNVKPTQQELEYIASLHQDHMHPKTKKKKKGPKTPALDSPPGLGGLFEGEWDSEDGWGEPPVTVVDNTQDGIVPAPEPAQPNPGNSVSGGFEETKGDDDSTANSGVPASKQRESKHKTDGEPTSGASQPPPPPPPPAGTAVPATQPSTSAGEDPAVPAPPSPPPPPPPGPRTWPVDTRPIVRPTFPLALHMGILGYQWGLKGGRPSKIPFTNDCLLRQRTLLKRVITNAGRPVLPLFVPLPELEEEEDVTTGKKFTIPKDTVQIVIPVDGLIGGRLVAYGDKGEHEPSVTRYTLLEYDDEIHCYRYMNPNVDTDFATGSISDFGVVQHHSKYYDKCKNHKGVYIAGGTGYASSLIVYKEIVCEASDLTFLANLRNIPEDIVDFFTSQPSRDIGYHRHTQTAVVPVFLPAVTEITSRSSPMVSSSYSRGGMLSDVTRLFKGYFTYVNEALLRGTFLWIVKHTLKRMMDCNATGTGTDETAMRNVGTQMSAVEIRNHTRPGVKHEHQCYEGCFAQPFKDLLDKRGVRTVSANTDTSHFMDEKGVIKNEFWWGKVEARCYLLKVSNERHVIYDKEKSFLYFKNVHPDFYGKMSKQVLGFAYFAFGHKSNIQSHLEPAELTCALLRNFQPRAKETALLASQQDATTWIAYLIIRMMTDETIVGHNVVATADIWAQMAEYFTHMRSNLPKFNGHTHPQFVYLEPIYDITAYEAHPASTIQYGKVKPAYMVAAMVCIAQRVTSERDDVKAMLQSHSSDIGQAIKDAIQYVGGPKEAYRLRLFEEIGEKIPTLQDYEKFASMQLKPEEFQKIKMSKELEAYLQYARTTAGLTDKKFFYQDPAAIRILKHVMQTRYKISITNSDMFGSEDATFTVACTNHITGETQDVVFTFRQADKMVTANYRELLICSPLSAGTARSLGVYYTSARAEHKKMEQETSNPNAPRLIFIYSDDCLTHESGMANEEDITKNDLSYTMYIFGLYYLSIGHELAKILLKAFEVLAWPIRVTSTEQRKFFALLMSRLGAMLLSGSMLTTGANSFGNLMRSIFCSQGSTSEDIGFEITDQETEPHKALFLSHTFSKPHEVFKGSINAKTLNEDYIQECKISGKEVESTELYLDNGEDLYIAYPTPGISLRSLGRRTTEFPTKKTPAEEILPDIVGKLVHSSATYIKCLYVGFVLNIYSKAKLNRDVARNLKLTAHILRAKSIKAQLPFSSTNGNVSFSHLTDEDMAIIDALVDENNTHTKIFEMYVDFCFNLIHNMRASCEFYHPFVDLAFKRRYDLRPCCNHDTLVEAPFSGDTLGVEWSQSGLG